MKYNNKIIYKMKILFLGGSGSLGTRFIERYKDEHKIFVYSRDERKHWKLNLNFKNINFIIGNINDYEKVKQTILRYKFDIIIIASAMKHVDRCEYELNESINTNLLGTKKVLDVIEDNLNILDNLKKVIFISTDKACSPINVYGMCKAISEKLMIEKSKYIKKIYFITVRYGNVLNSNGSIIPTLNNIGKNKKYNNFILTHKDMTRFLMTLDQAIDLIMYSLKYGKNGDIILPKLICCNIKDMIEIFSEKYNKPYIIGFIRPGEKLDEILINETESNRLEFNGDFKHIKPYYENYLIDNNDKKEYKSNDNPLTKIELKKYLINLKLI